MKPVLPGYELTLTVTDHAPPKLVVWNRQHVLLNDGHENGNAIKKVTMAMT